MDLSNPAVPPPLPERGQNFDRPAVNTPAAGKRWVSLLPGLGIIATWAGVVAAGDNRLAAYLVLGIGIVATAVLVLLTRNWLGRLTAKEQALENEVARLRHQLGEAHVLWEHSPACLFRTDAAGNWLAVNTALAQSLDGPAQSFLNNGWWDRLDRRDQANLAPAWREAIAKRQGLHTSVRWLNSGGESHWFTLNLLPLAEAPGFAGELRTADQEKWQAATIAAGQEHRDLALDNLPAAFFDWDLPRGEVHLSRQWGKILGGEALARSWSTEALENRVHPEDRPAAQAQLIAALNGATTCYRVEHRVRTDAGQWLWIESYGKVVDRNRDGNALRMLGYNRDISARKKLELALQDSEKQHREALDNLGEVLFRTDANGHWSYLNAAWTELTGHRVDDCLGRPLQHFVHPEDRGEFTHLWRGLCEGRLSEVRHEIRTAGKDGFDRWTELRLRPIKNEQGQLQGCTGSMHDVTDRHRAELELRRAKENAESANRVKTDFLANVSHEIRTPLHGIMGLTDLLLDSKIDETQRDHLQLIRSSSAVLLRTLNEVLDFSRIEAGKMGIELAEFDLGTALEAATKAHALAAARKGLTLRLKIAPEVPESLTGDAGRLQQVLDHLLDNAVKFTQKGEIELSVHTCAELSERVMLEFVVRDTGSGFTNQQRDNLFNAFSQAARPEDAKNSGVGLGLAIVKRLAEMMGGEVWAESIPGRGSTFHVTARFYRPNPMIGRALALPAPSPRAEVAPAHSTGLAVLLVEDDELNQKVAASMLRSLGHYPTVVANGADAIVAWETHRYDLVIMDLQLPLMGGIEATRYIREKEGIRGGQQAIVALTAHGDIDYRARCKELAITEYLVKPVEKNLLADAIDRALAAGNAAAESAGRSLSAPKALDLVQAKARINNDEEIFRKILELFRMGYEQPLLRCRAAAKEGDGQALAQAAHHLKGMAGNIGANTLRTAASQLEKLAREAHGESFADGLATLELALAEVLTELDQELGINRAATLAAS